MTKTQQLVGSRGEGTTKSILSGMGINMIERIATPVKLIPYHLGARRDVYRVVWGEKVSGDHRGLLVNGVSVLAETKTILDRNLRYGDLREHQPGKLQEHTDSNGLSLLVWVHSSGVYVMRWPIDGFGPGKSIGVDRAESERIAAVAYISVATAKYRGQVAQVVYDGLLLGA